MLRDHEILTGLVNFRNGRVLLMEVGDLDDVGGERMSNCHKFQFCFFDSIIQVEDCFDSFL